MDALLAGIPAAAAAGIPAAAATAGIPAAAAAAGIPAAAAAASAANDAAPAGGDDDATAPVVVGATAEEGVEARLLYKEATQLQPSELKRLVEQLSAFYQAQQGPAGVALTPPEHSAATLWPKIAGAGQDDGLQDNVMYIPNKHVGVVIGKGGEMIRTLQDRSQARIQVQPDKERDLSADTRQITLTGAPASPLSRGVALLP